MHDLARHCAFSPPRAHARTDRASQPALLLLAACAPQASTDGDVVSGSAPLTVPFVDTSTASPTSWTWDFDNDGFVDSTQQNPS